MHSCAPVPWRGPQASTAVASWPVELRIIRDHPVAFLEVHLSGIVRVIIGRQSRYARFSFIGVPHHAEAQGTDKIPDGTLRVASGPVVMLGYEDAAPWIAWRARRLARWLDDRAGTTRTTRGR